MMYSCVLFDSQSTKFETPGAGSYFILFYDRS